MTCQHCGKESTRTLPAAFRCLGCGKFNPAPTHTDAANQRAIRERLRAIKETKR